MLSFVVPVYKTPETLLRNCLDSILRYSRPMELICVLDSPDDVCGEILEKYAKGDARVRVFRNDRNMGPSYSRNRGMGVAVAEYLAFVDSDDEIVSDAYEKLIEIVKVRHLDIGMMTCSYAKEKYGVTYGECAFAFPEDSPNEFTRMARASEMVVYPHIFKRSTLIENGIRFEEDLSCGEDCVFTAQLFCNAFRCGFLNIVACNHVVHPDSLSNRPAPPNHLPQTAMMSMKTLDVMLKANDAERLRAVASVFLDRVFTFAICVKGRTMRQLPQSLRHEYIVMMQLVFSKLIQLPSGILSCWNKFAVRLSVALPWMFICWPYPIQLYNRILYKLNLVFSK